MASSTKREARVPDSKTSFSSSQSEGSSTMMARRQQFPPSFQISTKQDEQQIMSMTSQSTSSETADYITDFENRNEETKAGGNRINRYYEEMGPLVSASNFNEDTEEGIFEEQKIDLDEKNALVQQSGDSWLTKLSNFDKRMSEKVQRNNNTFVELSLFCVPAHMFNRTIIVFPMGLCVLLGAFKYDAMLTNNSFVTVGDSVPDQQKFGYGICFFILYIVSLLAMVCCTQTMKKTIRRERPITRDDTTRISDLRGKETGTFSMPSGDTSAAAVWCTLVATQFSWPLIYLLMPLVMLGRVYYQCHWIGDTLVGLFVGTFWGFVGSSFFYLLVPFFRFLVGLNSFVDLQP